MKSGFPPVLYDHQTFFLQRTGGISRYHVELARHLTLQGVPVHIALSHTRNQYIREAGDLGPVIINRVRGPIPEWLKPYPADRIIERIPTLSSNIRNSRLCIRSIPFGIFHPTYYDPYFLRDLGGRPFVVTIHDMIPELFPGSSFLYAVLRRNKRVLSRHAAAIIAISGSTREDLVRIGGIPREKIVVIPHGVREFAPAPDARLSPDPGMILYVGNRGGYKNFLPFLHAIRPLFDRYPALTMICAGGGSFSIAERWHISRWSLAGRVRQCTVSDRGLWDLYGKAAVFAHPSRYEGFGLPVLEAFSAGCPVVCSTGGSLAEVAGDAALTFDPGSEPAMRQAVETVLEDESLQKTLSGRGLDRVRSFTWERTARETRELYRSVSEMRPG